MQEVIAIWVKENLGVSVLILTGIILICIYAATAYGKMRKELESKPCTDHRKAIDEHTSRLNEDSKLLHTIHGQLMSLNKVESCLGEIQKTLQILAVSSYGASSLTQSHSPISLNDAGKKIADSLKLRSIIDANWDKISTIIKDQKNPYDIQMEFITQLIINFSKYLDKDSVEKIKNDAFARGIPLIEYMRMAGVLSRDRYFAEKGIDIDEVDKNAPID